MEDFDGDVSKLIEDYNSLPKEAHCPGMLQDFVTRWKLARDKLHLKLGRPM